MEITKEMIKTAQNYDKEYLERLKEIKTGLQLMVVNNTFETDVGYLEVPSALINIQSLINTGLSKDPDYYLNKRPPNVLHYISYDNYRGVLKFRNTGMPLWYQLEGETSIFYNMFETYRDLMKINGTRRDYKTVANLFNVEISKIGRIAEIFHWDIRIKAFEHFQEITRIRIRKEEAFAMESRHAKATMEYIDIVMQRIKNFSEKDLDKISPKVAVEMLKELQEMERLSRGVNPKKVSKLTSPNHKEESNEDKNSGNVTINQINTGDSQGFISAAKSEEEVKKEEKLLEKKLKRAKEITAVLEQITPSDDEAEEEAARDKKQLDNTIKDLKRKKRKREKDSKE